MNLDELKPGFELNALVAEAIGCKVDFAGSDNPSCYTACGCKKREHNNSISHGPFIIDVLKHFSTDLNDAFWAAEQVMDSSFSVDRHKDYGIDKRTGWCAEINGHSFSTFDDTPALAICKAILKLKETHENHEPYARRSKHL